MKMLKRIWNSDKAFLIVDYTLLTLLLIVVLYPLLYVLMASFAAGGILPLYLIPKKFSLPVSILIVSALFGFLHLQWNVGINVFCLSLVLCVLREITGTIHSGILLHMLKNGFAFYLLYVINMI